MNGPDPECKYPFKGLNYDLKTTKRVVFLKPIITNKNIIVGDYTYYDDPDQEMYLIYIIFQRKSSLLENFAL